MFTKFKKMAAYCRSSRQAMVIAIEIGAGISICLMSLLAFLFLTRELFHSELNLWDYYFSQLIYSLRTPQLTQVMLAITSFGAIVPLLVSTLIVIILLLKKHRKEAAIFCIALIMGTVLNTVLKTYIARDRPQISPLVIENTFSYPSNHSMNSTIFYGLISYFSFHFFRSRRLSIVISLLAICLIGLIGFSRVYLGVHYLTDVLAGYCAGFWWFVAVLTVNHTLRFYKLFKEET